MTFAPLSVVESWQHAVNAGNVEDLVALVGAEVKLVTPSSSVTGRVALRRWFVRAGFSGEVLRWFCRDGRVVVEQRRYDGRLGAAAFRVVGGRIVRYQRFDDLSEALKQSGLSPDDEVLTR